MAARLLRIVVLLAVAASAIGLGVWAWLEGRAERAREETRELSIKEAPRRVVDSKTNEVVIRLAQGTQERLGLVVQPVEHTEWQERIKLLGFSVLVPHRAAELQSPWTGILEPPPDGPMPTVGRQVRKGQLLATLLVQWSPSDRIQLENQLRDVRGTIGETEAEMAVTRKAVERLRKVTDGAVAARQLLEAEGMMAKLDARLTAARQREMTLEDALAKKESPVRFQFVVPQDGLLTDLKHRPGEVVSAGNVVATIYDPRELWVSVFALPGQLQAMQVPAEAEITFPGFSSQPLSSKLVSVKPHVEPQQQAQALVYGADNPDGRIPTGLQAEVRLPVGEPTDVVRVPRSAVLQLSQPRLVYLQRGAEEFVKHFVEIEDEDDKHVYVRPTFPADAKVVVRGAQVLLSEEYKESIQLVEEK